MRDLLIKKERAGDFCRKVIFGSSFNGWSLTGCDSDFAGNASKVVTEGICTTPTPLDNVGSLLVNILVGRED